MEKEIKPLMEKQAYETDAQFHSRLIVEDEKEFQMSKEKIAQERKAQALKDAELAEKIMKENG